MKFTQPLKIYLFKDQNRVDVSVKINETLVNGYRFTISDFEKIIDNLAPNPFKPPVNLTSDLS